MRIAIIDLGTNSVRFDVHEFGTEKTSRILHREKLMVRLGQEVFVTGKLNRQAIARTLEAFRHFKQICQQLRVQKIVAFGTSALREAADRDHLIHLVEQRTGIQLRVISGQEEAQLIAWGILANEKLKKGLFTLIDIGGGSTEITLCKKRTILRSKSCPLGAARLQQIFLKKSPPSSESVKALRQYIRNTLRSNSKINQWPKVSDMIGSSGTVKGLARIIKKQPGKDTLARKAISTLVKKMRTMTGAQLLEIPGMEAKRVDMILAGVILLEECMKMTGAKKITPTEYALRDGIFEEELERYSPFEKLNFKVHLPELYRRAKRFGVDLKRAQRVVQSAETLFDRLAPLHRLKPEWKEILRSAAVFREVGDSVSPIHRDEHSAYIIRHADLPFFEPWEHDFVARLCKHYADPDNKREEVIKGLDKSRVNAFLYLLSILQVANALASPAHKEFKIKRVVRDRKGIHIHVQFAPWSDLPFLRLEQQKRLFEAVFKKQLFASS